MSFAAFPTLAHIPTIAARLDSAFDLPAFVLAQVAELHFYCKRAESLRIGTA